MQIMCTLDTSHRNSPLLLTKVSGALRKIHSCLLVLVVAMFSLCLCIHPPGQATKVKPFPLMSLLPKHNMSQYYRYYGSLTTPPCSEAVVWTLYEVPIYISWSQVSCLGSDQVLFIFLKDLLVALKYYFWVWLSPQLAQFTSQIFSTEEDAEQVTPLQNNFRHIHHIFSRVVSASIDAKLLRGAAGRSLLSATSVHLLPVLLLGGFLSGL